MAGDVGLDCYGIADGERFDGGVSGDDYAGGFVAENVVLFDYHCRANAAMALEAEVSVLWMEQV